MPDAFTSSPVTREIHSCKSMGCTSSLGHSRFRVKASRPVGTGMKPHEKARAKASKRWQSRLCARADDIFRWRKLGMSLRAIAKRLTDEGFPVTHSAIASFVNARKPKTTKSSPSIGTASSPASPPKLVLSPVLPQKRKEQFTEPTIKRPFIDPEKMPQYLRGC